MLCVDDFAVSVGAELVWSVSAGATNGIGNTDLAFTKSFVDTDDDVGGKPDNMVAEAGLLLKGFFGTDDDIGG